MDVIFLNTEHLSDTTNNNRLTYKFQNSVQFKSGTRIALQNINMYYSWYNVTTSNNNNKFSYTWWDENGDETEPIEITIADGYYTIDTLNEAIQEKLVINKHYVTKTINGVLSNLYFIEILANASFYKFQLNCYYVPTEAENTSTYNYTKPSGATWVFPTTGATPTVVIPNTNITKLLGFNAGTYPPSQQTSIYSVLSNNSPEIDPVSSIIVTCSLVNQRYSYPDNLIYNFTYNVAFGEMISISPPNQSWCDMKSGIHNSLEVAFYDQNYNPLKILDKSVTVTLVIHEPVQSQLEN